MSSHAAQSPHNPHSHTALTNFGFSIGIIGIVGLVIALIALIPINAYNIAISIRTATHLKSLYGKGTFLIPGPYRPVQLFLLGSIAFSIITIMLLLATCWRNASSNHHPHRRAKRVNHRGERRRSKASSIAESIASTQSDHSAFNPFLARGTSGWIGRLSTVTFLAQFCWAIFGKLLILTCALTGSVVVHCIYICISDATYLAGSHTLYFTLYDEPLPSEIRLSAITSLLILWANYAIMVCFSIVFCLAACCVLMGGIASAYDEEDSVEASETSHLLGSGTVGRN